MNRFEQLKVAYRDLAHRYGTIVALVMSGSQLPPGGLLERLRAELDKHPNARCPCCRRSPVSTSTWNRLTAQDDLIKRLKEQLEEAKCTLEHLTKEGQS